MPSTSRRRRRIPSTSSCGRKLSYLRYDRSKNTDPRSLSTSTATITGPDRTRRHRIVSALSLPSRRAAGGLRQPSECRALLAFVAIGRRLMRAVPGTRRSSCEIHNSMRRGCMEDPKTSAHIYGIRGLVPSPSRRRRRIIPSASFSSLKLT